ncbi:MAG: hypothetical protein GX557_09285 [Chloroflexi bacterium]|nr:hypothetical protein [Chloroflexota bacterium]
MAKRFRALGTLSGLFKVIAWVLLILGILATILVAAVGVLQASRGVSDLVAGVPILNQDYGVLPAILMAVGVLIGALLIFVWIMALAEGIQLMLAIERNTRETAAYLRGEGQMPEPPAATTWQGDDSTR